MWGIDFSPDAAFVRRPERECRTELKIGHYNTGYPNTGRAVPCPATDSRVRVNRKSGAYASGGFGLAEIEFYVEFFFEEIGAAFGVAQIFGDIASSFYLNGDGIALE